MKTNMESEKGFFDDRKLTWQPFWNEAIARSGVGFVVIYFGSTKSSRYACELGNKLQKIKGKISLGRNESKGKIPRII